MFFKVLVVIGFVVYVASKDVVINVGGNDTNTFEPQRVEAKAGDFVVFKFISGNHSATQSDFASPCIPAHITNTSVNGFDSGLRIGTNGTSATDLRVPINESNNATAIWFYDAFPGACGGGNVGVINSNETSDDNIAAFMRNAERLNGTDSASGNEGISSFTGLPTGTGSAPRSSQSTSSAHRVARDLMTTFGVMAILALIPLFH